MTTNELLEAKDKIIQEQAEKLQQMSEQIDELKKSVELYRQAAAMARAARFGNKSKNTVPEAWFPGRGTERCSTRRKDL